MAFDSALPGTLEEKLGVVWGQMCIAYDELGTAAGERLLHAMFVGMFASSRTPLPTVYSQLHSKAAVGGEGALLPAHRHQPVVFVLQPAVRLDIPGQIQLTS